jgi:CrcB protein
MSKLLLVALGGAIGSAARYLTGLGMQSLLGVSFPYGTLAVNVMGSFFMCAVMHLSGSANIVTPELRLLLTTGVMGGFTTYSAFDYEAYRYVQQGSHGTAGLYVGVTLLACFAAGAAGDLVARLVVRT